MVIIDLLTVARACQAMAVTVPLLLVSLAPRIAYGEPVADPAVAMIANVLPAVVRVVSVRPSTPEEHKSGGAAGAEDKNFGAGYIIDSSGYIGTNKHVIDGAIAIFVVTADGARHQAQIAGMTGHADVALLKIDPGVKPLPFVRFGDSGLMHPGDHVIAIGSPFGFDQTVTAGIISAVNRDIKESPFDDYLQIDAAINHGNSGGPLFNVAGEVIGMNSVIFAPTPGSAGVAFAVPSSTLRFVFERLMKTGEVRAGMLPFHTQAMTWTLAQALDMRDLKGALVTSGADGAGDLVRAGDVIRTFNGEDIQDPRDLARKAAREGVGDDAVLNLIRDGGPVSVHVTIVAYPETKPIALDAGSPMVLGLDLASVEGTNGQPIVVAASVDPNGTAAAGGLKQGDIIVEVQRTFVSDTKQASRIIWARSAPRHGFAAILIEREKKRAWLSIAVPP